MALESGTRFGAYEVVEAIGAGGMGEVYRAHDTTLERDVAIKVLPASFAEDAGRVERFDREAKTLAALNHPNIAQIYGLEKSAGTTALVMELVDGATLEERIAKGPIPADEALGIAMQIADALEAAHSQNIIHRDLKPANIKLKRDGTVKVLDFGIAKALAPENLISGPQSPIMTTPATQVGVILGTAAYMSPEQAKGKAVDQRTDIWAFGCVLYEMLTGQLAFGADDVATTLARVIERDTNLDSLPAAISPAVRHTINLCLRKDAKRRVADIRDVKLGLEGELELAHVATLGIAARDRPLWTRLLPTAAALVVAVVTTALVVWILSQPDPSPVNRFAYDLPQGQIFQATDRHVLSLSQDGRRFVYNTMNGLYLRNMNEVEARLVAGPTAGVDSPVLSPDGLSIAYWDGQLRRISVNGGSPVTIAREVANPTGATWTSGDAILIGGRGGIYRVSANGGVPEVIVPAVDGEILLNPQLLPGGDLVLFTSSRLLGPDTGDIAVQSSSTGERTTVVQGSGEAHYVPTGHIVYSVGDALFAVRFDLASQLVRGAPVPVLQGVMRSLSGAGEVANFDIAHDGTLVYVVGGAATAERALVWVDREGTESPIDAPPRAYFYPRVSPDGTKVALDVRDEDLDIWILDLEGSRLTRLTFDLGQDEFPVWSPDGTWIAFSSTRDGGSAGDTDIFRQAADGTGTAERIAEGGGQAFPSSFLPNATGILLRMNELTGDPSDDVGVLMLDGSDRPQPLLDTQFAERNPVISPDGRWMAYVSSESGTEQIYVRPFPDVNAGRWQVSTNGGSQPTWSPDGSELYYRDGEAMIAVPVQTDPVFSPGRPAQLFEDRYFAGGAGRSYDVAPDGRFLMVKAQETQQSAGRIIIVQNWFEELERLVPTQ